MRISIRSLLVYSALLAIITLHATGILAPLESVLASSLRPLQTTLTDWFGFHEEQNDSTGDAEELQNKVTQLTIDVTLLREALREREAALEHENLLNSRNLKGVLATVIGRPPEGDSQVLVLNKGLGEGVSVGQPVVANNGVLIGTISEAEAGRSIVLLLTNTGSSIAAEVDNDARTPGVVSGEHGLTMAMTLIPQNETISVGQVIVTSAVNEAIPSNLIIGEITDVQFGTGDLFQSASVRPLIDYQRVRSVTILVP